MSDERPSRDDLRREGRGVVRNTAQLLVAGGLLGSITSVFIVTPLISFESMVRALAFGVGSSLFVAIALWATYRLTEGRLIDMYLDDSTGEGGGEPT